MDQNKEKKIIREHIISEYGIYIQNHPPNGAEIRDVSELPYPKEEILDAITLEIVRESDDQRVEIMKACALMLADFQENIGEKPLTMLGINAADTHSMIEAVKKDKSLLESTFNRITEAATDLKNKEKFDSLRKIVDEEYEHIKRVLMVAVELRKQTSQDKKDQILG